MILAVAEMLEVGVTELSKVIGGLQAITHRLRTKVDLRKKKLGRRDWVEKYAYVLNELAVILEEYVEV